MNIKTKVIIAAPLQIERELDDFFHGKHINIITINQIMESDGTIITTIVYSM